MSQAADMPRDESASELKKMQNELRTLKQQFSLWFLASLIALSSLLWLGSVVQTFFIMPRFEKMFFDFRMRLPWSTEWALRNGSWFVPACLVGAVAVSLLVRKRLGWVVVLILLPVLLNLALFLSYFLPYYELLQGLEGGNKK